MNFNLMYIVSLVIVFNCVISVAKNSEEKAVNSDLISPEAIQQFSEGSHSVSPTKRRIKGRKGAIFDVADNKTDTMTDSVNNTNNAINNNPEIKVIATMAPTNSTLPINSTISSTTTIPSTTVSIKHHKTTTTKPLPTTTTTLKPVKKPTITFSADDDPEILASEKRINYNVTRVEEENLPKTSQDTDRTILAEENRTRRNYVLYMSLAFALPVTFTLIHVFYKKVKNWMEIREYQRVDFLVDGMYIS